MRGRFSLIIFVWIYSLRDYYLGTIASELSLCYLRLGTFVWKLSFRKVRLGSFVWEPALGNLPLKLFGWALSFGHVLVYGSCRLASFV